MSEHRDAEMPGAWTCGKCQFRLQENILFAGNGAISADTSLDTSPVNERCPNDGSLMRPLTWREVNEELYEKGIELSADKRRLDWLDLHCSFVADFDYNLGPFKLGELRKLADAGIEADSKKNENNSTCG